MKKLGCITILIVLVSFLALACAAPAASHRDTVRQTPTPAETPVLPIDIEAIAARAFREAFRYDIEDAYSLAFNSDTMTELEAHFSILTGLGSGYVAAAERALEAAKAAVNACDESLSLKLDCEKPDWRLIVALCALSEAPSRLAQQTVVESSRKGGTLTLSLSLPDFRELIAWDSAESRNLATTILSYLRAVYDEAGGYREYSAPVFPEGFIESLADPLPGSWIKEGWLLPRSNSTRKHMGTDIKVREGTDIHSCSAGTILAIGYNDTAGNYVSVLDGFGYEYHYCHMVELTDFLSVGDTVLAGDVIGHVGDTGNSDAPHLHLAMITPEYEYIDPYPVLVEVRKR